MASDRIRLTGQVSKRAAWHLREFRREVEQLMPDRIKDVLLFGSRARGEAKRGSDYDVAVLVDQLSNRRSIDHALCDAAYDHILAGIHIRPMAVPADWRDRRDIGRFAINLDRDGISIE